MHVIIANSLSRRENNKQMSGEGGRGEGKTTHKKKIKKKNQFLWGREELRRFTDALHLPLWRRSAYRPLSCLRSSWSGHRWGRGVATYRPLFPTGPVPLLLPHRVYSRWHIAPSSLMRWSRAQARVWSHPSWSAGPWCWLSSCSMWSGVSEACPPYSCSE